MNKKLLSKAICALIFILASNQISKIYCMNEQTYEEHYGTWHKPYEEERADIEAALLESAVDEVIRLQLQRNQGIGHSNRTLSAEDQQVLKQMHEIKELETQKNRDKECLLMALEDADSKIVRLKAKNKKKQLWSNPIWNSASITIGLFLGQLALGLKPHVIDIIPNCLTGTLLGYSTMNSKNNYATLTTLTAASLWMAYTLWRVYNQTYYYQYNHYNHWLGFMLSPNKYL